MCYLVEFVLALFRIVDRGSVPVVPEVAGSYQAVASCIEEHRGRQSMFTAKYMLAASRFLHAAREWRFRPGPTVVTWAARDEDAPSAAGRMDAEDCCLLFSLNEE